jgi:small subunit ribosomal protein S8
MTDPIADLLTRIRNGILSRKATVDVPGSKLKKRLAEVLRDEGFLSAVTESVVEDRSVLSITLRWDAQHQPAISGVKRSSKPGQRWYVAKDAIPKIRGGLGTAVISTSKGLMTDREARKAGLGGEVMCEIW